MESKGDNLCLPSCAPLERKEALERQVTSDKKENRCDTSPVVADEEELPVTHVVPPEPYPATAEEALPPLPQRDQNFYTLRGYLKRCTGAGHKGPPFFTFSYDVLFTCVFSIFNLTILSTLEYYGLDPYDQGLLSYLPSFGATSTLIFYLYTAPGAQPRALILSHICGAFLGISCAHITSSLEEPFSQLLACTIAVSILTALMMMTNTFQPSASATTCLAALHVHGHMSDAGYMFLVTPATIGPVISVFFAWLFNNIVPWRHCYPCWL